MNGVVDGLENDSHNRSSRMNAAATTPDREPALPPVGLAELAGEAASAPPAPATSEVTGERPVTVETPVPGADATPAESPVSAAPAACPTFASFLDQALSRRRTGWLRRRDRGGLPVGACDGAGGRCCLLVLDGGRAEPAPGRGQLDQLARPAAAPAGGPRRARDTETETPPATDPAAAGHHHPGATPARRGRHQGRRGPGGRARGGRGRRHRRRGRRGVDLGGAAAAAPAVAPGTPGADPPLSGRDSPHPHRLPAAPACRGRAPGSGGHGGDARWRSTGAAAWSACAPPAPAPTTSCARPLPAPSAKPPRSRRRRPPWAAACRRSCRSRIGWSSGFDRSALPAGFPRLA